VVWKHVLCENIRYQFDISSLDFVVNRFFMKLFQTNNIDIVNYCRAQFKYFDLPSTVVEKRSKKSVAKYRPCENVICEFALLVPLLLFFLFFVLISAVLFVQCIMMNKNVYKMALEVLYSRNRHEA